MGRKIIVALCLLCFGYSGFAQLNMSEFNDSRNAKVRNGLFVLSAWSVGNIAWGVSNWNVENAQERAFHHTNVYWNVVNLGISGYGIYKAFKESGRTGLGVSVQRQREVEQIFLFNAGLDIAYVVGGFWSMEYAKRANDPDKWRGFGQSAILQGSALFLFDGVMYYIIHQHGNKLSPYLQQLELTPGGVSWTIPLDR